MKKNMVKAISLMLCAVMLLATISACNKEGSDDDTSFTYQIDVAEPATFYEEYEDNPAVQYWLSKEWDADGDGKGKKISIDFISLPAGAEQDNVNTWLGTGDYPSIMSTTYSAQKIKQLYEEGIALDITEYVEKYMPNYLAWAKSHPELASRLTSDVNGERRYLGLYALNDVPEPQWGGFCYRRDWIVKYGKNPETGAAFSGHWEDNGNWVDDVVFPSGNTDPIYISDWEWMLDIFATALKELGIEDGYPMSLYYSGYISMGDFMGGFGDIAGFYVNDDGKAAEGFESEGFRAYLECMNKWFANGWIDKQFDERANDMFFMVDMGSVYAGKVGVWYGMTGSLGGSMDTSGGDTSNPTNGIVVAGAPQPINDLYGSDACKNKEPVTYFTNSMFFGPIIFTDKCKDKDLATLFTALDYLYDPETGARLKSFGLSKEQVEEFDCQWYRDHGLEDGSYSIVTDENGTTKFLENPVVSSNQDGLVGACRMLRTLGLGMFKDRLYPYTDCVAHWIDMWGYYDNPRQIGTEITDQFTPEQSDAASALNNNIITYMSRTIPKFVKGELDPLNDKDWNEYCAGIREYNPSQYCDFVDQVLGG